MKKKKKSKQQKRQKLKKIQTETFLGWYNDLDSFYVLKVHERVISNKLVIDSKKCNQRQNSLSTSMRLNFLRLLMQNI